MRVLACILSIYVVILTAIPCVDKLTEDHLPQTGIGGKVDAGHQHHDGDQCSPFCTCNCCATPVIQQEFFIQFDNFTFLHEYTANEYISVFTSDYLSSIWQPPQII